MLITVLAAFMAGAFTLGAGVALGYSLGYWRGLDQAEENEAYWRTVGDQGER